ncbi:sphingosine kinase 2 isoform X2 [Tripterygium wilfordii]|uniref:Sphingosine kinase 2 isoform X2 n=1 Tax=Tripterygium wilfordii TaxID=458696 RepID=A0A7J7C3C2_TRIWF|nr:sphingosine kinase 2 isoform X2 [Tripterygium wilfordii]
MPLGVVPAGTGNGTAKSLLDSVGQPCTAFNAVLAIIRGHKRSLDVATILQGEIKFFSVLMLAWVHVLALVSLMNILISRLSFSENYLNKQKITEWCYELLFSNSVTEGFLYISQALQRVLHLRRYDGRICFVPAPGFEAYGEPANYNDGPSDTQRNRDSSLEQASDVQQNGYQGPDVKLENLDWRAINGPFVSVWLHNVPWGGEDTLATPDAKFSDGYLDLIIIRDCPRLSLLPLMTKMSSGGHVRSPLSMYLMVKAFVLEPGPRTDDPTKEGIIDADGEVLARGKETYKHDQKALMSYDKLQIKIDQGLATVFSPV